MTADGLAQAQAKMREAGVAEVAIDVFSHYYGELAAGASGLIREQDIDPLLEPPQLEDQTFSDSDARAALGRTAIIKLNGGLGTSMGIDRAKSLLPVRPDATFLDIIVRQVLAARDEFGASLPLLFMNSFRTRDDTLSALSAYTDLPVEGIPLDFMQNSEPKLRADDLTPVSWPADPSLEWCPPGHGDLYTAILASGVLQKLVEHGYRYVNVSNSDNLGAAPNAQLAAWFAASGAPYAAEICHRTAADRKGGHLAFRRDDGSLILRDTAQTAPEDMDAFTDEACHPYFHTNNLWFDLEQLQTALQERGSVLGLPLIKNHKTVDPTDPDSPEVVQLETAMGAAIGVFAGAQAIGVPRSRFLPVKTTNDLLLLRSDAYAVAPNGTLSLQPQAAPLIDLDPQYYKTLAVFDARFPEGAPSLRQARSLRVRGDWTFAGDVTVTGDVELEDRGEPATVAAGTRL